ncbi:hypothetical protein V1478_008771 [Vespula squamosa]|uniref:Uncharacterized protein n=1 Tax=Vespula squamosa TaxID=30214 RepID=A0ABD2AUI7_VESSQ
MNEDYVDAEAGVIKSQKQPLLLTPWTNLSSVGYAFRCVVGPRRSSPHTTDNEPFGNQKYSLRKLSFAFVRRYLVLHATSELGKISRSPPNGIVWNGCQWSVVTECEVDSLIYWSCYKFIVVYSRQM